MYLHRQQLINEIAVDEPDPAAAIRVVRARRPARVVDTVARAVRGRRLGQRWRQAPDRWPAGVATAEVPPVALVVVHALGR